MRGILRQMSLLKYSNILTFYDKIGITLKNVKKGKARTQEHSEGTGQY